jgi:hypothetical protein
MSQYNNIVITPNIGVSSNPNIEFSGVGNTTTKLEYYGRNNGSLVIQSEDELLFSVSNVDEENPDLVYVINDDDGLPALTVSNSGITSISVIRTPIAEYIAIGAASTTKITTKHYDTDGGYLAFESGIGTSHIFSVGSQSGENGEVYVIGNDDGLPLLSVSNNGETALINVSLASTVSAASTDKMEISAVSRDNGLLEIANYGGNQLFSVSNNQTEDAFAVYRYANYENLSITSFENRKLFNVSSLGIVTTYGALRVGTSNTVANSSVYNEFYGRLNVRAPFSTTTEYVSIVPKFSDKGALSFESPVGAAQTDRGTQIFSISNNLESSIFRVNDLNRNPIFEASASGRVGIGTTNPQTKLEVHGTTRVTSTGSPVNAYVDVNHYKDFEYVLGVGVATDPRNAISFESASGIGTYGMPGPLLTLIDGGNVFSASGFKYWSGAEPTPAIDVTIYGDVGIGSTQPTANLDVSVSTLVSGITTLTNEVVIRDRITFNETINPGINSTTSIRLEPQTPGISTYAPTRGSLLFNGVLDQSLNGGQLVTVVNDNDSLFTINRFAGLSTTNVTGTRSVEAVVDVTSAGRVGIGTTVPSTKMDVRGDLRVGINTSQGLILTSPDGTTFRLIVDNSGNLSAISTTL